MWGWCHYIWFCFPLVVDQQRFQLPSTSSDNLRLYLNSGTELAGPDSSKSNWWLTLLTNMVREPGAPPKTSGLLEANTLLHQLLKCNFPWGLKHGLIKIVIILLSFTLCWHSFKCFTSINSFNPHNTPMKWASLFLILPKKGQHGYRAFCFESKNDIIGGNSSAWLQSLNQQIHIECLSSVT